jgi:ketosteroid isomerase-like protein
MKPRRMAFARGCLLIFLLTLSPRSWGEDLNTAIGQADSERISAIHQQFWDAFAERDLWAISQLWDRTDNSISAIFPAAATPAIGWENIAESYRRVFSHNRDIRVDPRIVRLHAASDLAWLIAAVRFEANQTQTGQPVMINRMLVTEIFRRQQGTWYLVHYHGHNPAFIPPKETHIGMYASGVVPRREENDVWLSYGKFSDAFEKLDLGAMFDLIASDDDVSAIQPAAPVPFLGPENVLAGWRKTFADMESITCDPLMSKLSVSGSMAWITDLSQFHIVFKNNPGEVRHFHNVNTTFIFRKQQDSWQLVHYHAHIGFSYEDHSH